MFDIVIVNVIATFILAYLIHYFILILQIHYSYYLLLGLYYIEYFV